MRLAALVVGLTAALAACTSSMPTSPSTPLNLQLTLAAGETAAVQGTSTRLRFLSVSGDSRCPVDAVCIQGGDALVRIDVVPADGGPSATYDLHTGSMQPVLHRNLTIALVELRPYPFSGRSIPPDEYRATFRIMR